MNGLADLKNEVLDELIKVTDEDGLNPQEKFDLLMSRYINTGEQTLLSDALVAAKGIDDIAIKGQALMQLLEEIDIAELDSEPKEGLETRTESGNSEPTVSTSIDNESNKA